LVADEVDRIEGKYGWYVTLGDQDYITNLGFEVQELKILNKFQQLSCFRGNPFSFIAFTFLKYTKKIP
jgi:hypothetical protein